MKLAGRGQSGTVVHSYRSTYHRQIYAHVEGSYRRKNVKLPCRPQIYIFNYIYMPSSLLPELGVRLSLVIGRPRSGEKIADGVYGTTSTAIAKA